MSKKKKKLAFVLLLEAIKETYRITPDEKGILINDILRMVREDSYMNKVRFRYDTAFRNLDHLVLATNEDSLSLLFQWSRTDHNKLWEKFFSGARL